MDSRPPRSLSPRPEGESAPGASSSPKRAPTDEQSRAAPIKVLLVSDLLLVRAGIRRLLGAARMNVVGEVQNREEAATASRRERPNVILIDLDSRADTFACVEALVAAQDGRIVVLSDRSRAGDHPTLVDRGASGLVLKHEPPEVLIKAIEKVHAGEVWIDRVSTAQALTRIARRRRSEDVEAERIATLTRREREIIGLVGDGLKNPAIAQRLFISDATVRNHLTSVLDKLGLSDRFELAVYAFKHGLVRYPDPTS